MTNPSPSATVGANVKAELARRSISQKVLGERLGLSQVSISARLRGVTPFDVNELHQTADFLGLPISVLLEGAVAEAKSA